MKQINKWFALLLVCCASLGSYAQTTCGTATTLTPDMFDVAVTLPSNTDTVWYQFTPAENGYLTISSCDKVGNPDTRLFLFEGSCASLNTVGTSDNDCGLAAMLNDKRVEAGKTYFLRWDNKSTTSALSFTFDFTFVSDANYANPANDDICDATALTLGSAVAGNNEDATVQGFAEHNLPISIVSGTTENGWIVDRNIHNSVWYSFVAPVTGSVQIAVSADFDVQAALFSGSCSNIGGLTLMGAQDDGDFLSSLNIFNYCVTAGQTYFILIDGFGTESGDFVITTSSIDLSRPHIALIDVATDDPKCPGEEIYNLTGSLVVAADSSVIGDANYVNSLQYSWTNSSNAVVGTASTLTDRTAGTYTLTITDTCGRTFTKSVTLTDTVINPLDLVLVSTTNPTCRETPNGTVTLSHTGGYLYTNGLFANTDSLNFTIKHHSDTDATNAEIAASTATGVASFAAFNSLFEGTYRIYVEDFCGNIDSVTFIIVDPEFNQIQLSSNGTVNPYCPGTSTGSIDLFAAGGEGMALVYTWYRSTDGGTSFTLFGQTTQDLNNVPEGMYKVVVSDPCGNQEDDSLTFTLVDPVVAPLTYTATQTNPTSFDAKNGSISITLSGGKPGYSATWLRDGILWTAKEDMLILNNLAQGIYRVFISDTCESAGSIDTTFVLLAPIKNDSACKAIKITEMDSLTTYHNINATNTGEGALSIPLNQDEGYDGWAETNINQSVWFTFVAPESGAVSITANHYQGLVSNLNFDPQVALFEADTCNNYNTFNLIAANDNNFNGGAINDAYLEASCLNPGQTYYIMVDGYQGVGQEGIFSLFLDVIPVSPLNYTVAVTQPNCIEESGTVSVTNVTGGVYREAPEVNLYRYTFNNTTGTLNVDAFGNITAVNGVPATSLTFSDLAQGSYTLTIKDTCGNNKVTNITIAPITATPFDLDYTLESPMCPGDEGGEITFTITGGGTPGQYSYEIRFGASNGTLVASGDYDAIFAPYTEELIGAGLYFLIVEDACGNSNIKEFVFELEDPEYTAFAAVASYDKPSCPDSADANLKFVLTGGSMQASYSLWLVGDPFNMLIASGSAEDSAVISGLASGEYLLMLEDACDGDTTIEITILDPVVTDIEVVTTIVNPTLNGGNNGSFTYNISGGFPEYTVFIYEIDTIGGEEILDTLVASFKADDFQNYTVTGLSAGFYRLAINDDCGDVIDDADEVIDFQIFNPPVNNMPCSATVLTMDGDALTGTTVAATVDAGESSITPLLDEDCGSFTGWCLGNGIDGSVWYSLVVPSSGAFSVEVMSETFDPQIAVYTVDTCGNYSSYELVAANDDKLIPEGNPNAYVEAGCLEPGTVVYILVDAADYPAAGEFTIEASMLNEGPLDVLSNVINATTETSFDGIINIQVIGGVRPYTYSWTDNGDTTGITTEDRTNLGPGTYTLTVVDKCGTTVTETFVLAFEEASNDDACNAKWLPVDDVNYIFSNIGASIQPGEFAIAPNANSTNCFSDTNWCKNDGLDGTVWFKFIAPSDSVRVDLCNDAQNDIDPQLAVYAVELCAEFGTYTMLGANDDSPTCSFGSVLTLSDLTPCETYYIMIDSDEGGVGEFGIKLTDLKSTLNAGRDTTINACQNSGSLNLRSFLAPGTQSGVFVDTDDTEALGGDILNTNAVDVGVFNFTYVVADSCGDELAGADYSTITVNVRNCIGIEEAATAGASFTVYPNPNNGIFNLENNGADADVTVEVFDITGKRVYAAGQSMGANARLTVDLNAAAKGMYTIRITKGDNSAEYHRVVVQ